MNHETPVSIGAEVEIPYPTSFRSNEVKAECLKILKAFYAKNHLVLPFTETGIVPAHILSIRTESERFAPPGIGEAPRDWATHKWEDSLPAEFRSPDGWERGWESAHEFRFRGGATTMREVCHRFDTLGDYFKAWGHTEPDTNYGTHIHFGVRDWLFKRYPKHSTHRDTDAPYENTVSWGLSPAARLVFAAINLRHQQLMALVEPRRRAHNCGGTFPNELTQPTPLWVLHNYLSTGGYRNHTALQIGRKGIPTFELRVFESTTNTNAIKGWVALMVSILKNCERLITDEILDSIKPITDRDSRTGALKWPAGLPATAGLIVEPDKFTMEHLKDEIWATGFWPAPLCSWIDETLKNGGCPTPFEGTLHELYTDGGTAKNGTTKTKARDKKSGGRIYDMPESMQAAA